MGQRLVRLTTEFWVDKGDALSLVQDATWDGPQPWHRLMLETLGLCEHPHKAWLDVPDHGFTVEIELEREDR